MATWVNIMDIIYPVGSVYLNKSSISPASTIGGTWSQVKGGCLAATGYTGYADAGEFGGYFNIAVSNLPAHNHTPANSGEYFSTVKNISGQAGKWSLDRTASSPNFYLNGSIGGWSDIGMPLYTSSTGGAGFLSSPLCLIRLDQNSLVGGCNG